MGTISFSGGGKLPRRPESSPPAINKMAVAALRILLVDNLVSWRQKMKVWVVDVGTPEDDVLEASAHDEAMEMLGTENYDVDVVVCEWDDESVGAAALLQQIKGSQNTARIGFIAMCGNDPAAIRDARAAGANEVIVKPVNAVNLLGALSKVATTLKPRTDDTKKRLSVAASNRPQSQKLSSTIAQELRGGGKLGRYRLGAVIATGPYRGKLYWVESGTVFVRETRADGNIVEYRATPGKFFGEAAFSGETIVTLHAVTETEVIVGWQEKDAFAKTMTRIPILNHYFKTITVERHRNNVVVDMPAEASEGGLGGTLESLSFPDLMQMMTVTKKTGVLHIESAGDEADIYLYGGVVRHATLGKVQGDEVVFRVVLWAGGRFAFRAVPDQEGPQTITTDVNFLLMEGIRRKELLGGGPKPPGPTSIF